MMSNNFDESTATEGTINIPGSSENNLSLSVDIPSTSGDDINLSTDGSARFYKQNQVTSKAWEFLKGNAIGSKYKNGAKFLTLFDKTIKGYGEIEFPIIDVFSNGENDLVNFQWDVDDTTLGIGVDTEIDNCFWFLISGKKDRDIRARGGLDKPESIIPWLLYIMEKKARG